jgi:acyl carrier protein phosphodiesterase
MNFLAHAYLSFNHPQVLAGNMTSDFIKGKTQYHYPPAIQAGIRLHRSIDAFTDSHWATKKAQEVFRKDYRLYSGPITDVIYDHYVANDPEIFKDDELLLFSMNVYKVLEEQSSHLPPRFLTLLPHMKEQNWLWGYSTKEGIERSLQGLVRRSVYLNDHTAAFSIFNDQYGFLQDCYTSFFKDVKAHALEEFRQLIL